MATASASRLQGNHANYVFKMQYDAGGPSTVNRRYGYSGELALPQVYEVRRQSVEQGRVPMTDPKYCPNPRQGLQERASQAFGISRENTRICVRDSLGNPHLRLDSYQAFLRHVYMPLQQRPREAKIDEKKRIVLAFVVYDKQELTRRLANLEVEAKDCDRRAQQEFARAREIAEALEAQTKKQKLARQAVLAKAQAEVRAQHASARPAIATANPASKVRNPCSSPTRKGEN